MRLSDLLTEAKADAPAPRYAVDDALAAGRRRLRRRNTGWALAAVVAVVAAIGVPQLVNRPSALPAVRPPVAPSVTPTVRPTAPNNVFPFNYTFGAYTVGDYRVFEPSVMALGWSTATIREVATGEPVAVLTVFPPGVNPVFPPKGGRTRGAQPVNGRPAFYIESDGPDVLAFEHADGGLAAVTPKLDQLPKADLHALATAFELGRGQTPTLAFEVGYVPADYRLISVSASNEKDEEMASSAVLVTAEMTDKMLAREDRNLPLGTIESLISVRFGLPEDAVATPEKPQCSKVDGECQVAVGEYRLIVKGHGRGISLAELRKVIDSVTTADPADPATWTPAREAFPTFVRLTVD